ncbi:3-keto-5-aminohexanoate cleavage protein [Thiofilum flexile]|uniref:3-keto-5-aminohexanoate cleavage protein n=1 Tax=Thiofilum flexile TaxID=125627 RepID=UPI00036B1E57|nr:3-keto-5-aminohexanoate cleavage protein [Thiofilum flexile]
MLVLPNIMVAPNGARRTKADHPELPMTIPEIVACAKACYQAGAGGIHAHVRDAQGRHVLDVGRYQELLTELTVQVPDLVVQVTSEAAGIYQAVEQQTIMRALAPAYMSVAWREMVPNQAPNTLKAARDFYAWAADNTVTIQHILYSADDLLAWLQAIDMQLIPWQTQTQVLFVLGRYTQNQQSSPQDLIPFLQLLDQLQLRSELQWAVCAFGVSETECLLAAAKQGGCMRVGFENSLWQADGSLAANNQERVTALKQALQALE